MDRRLTALLEEGSSPAHALREVQLQQLTAWRDSDEDRPPMIWQAYTYVGVGAAG
jgi:hypothetical protein